MKLKVFFVFLLGVTLIAAWFCFQEVLLMRRNQDTLFVVRSGTSAHKIAQELYEKKLLASPKIFVLYLRAQGKTESLKPGTYKFSAGHFFKIAKDLSSGNIHCIKVSLPEGWSAWQIAKRLQARNIIDDAESFNTYVLENKLEGTLFPETYFFQPHSSNQDIVAQMQQQFKKVFDLTLQKRAQEVGLSQKQVITLASIIEREVQNRQELSRVASVYHNRLKKNIPLQACPSVQYALGQGKFWKDQLTYKDLKVNSIYNTYRHKGLPPEPICNPGKAAIKAVLYPAETEDYYFVAKGDGSHYFSKTFAQHSRFSALAKQQKKNANQ